MTITDLSDEELVRLGQEGGVDILFETKRRRLRYLSKMRKLDSLPPHKSFGEFHEGRYDQEDYVVPWSASAHNCNADVMVMGQDWNSENNLSGPFNKVQQQCGQIPDLPTNRNLKTLLEQHIELKFEQTYATDLFVFAKPGGMTGPIPINDLLYCAWQYAIPQIQIVVPLIVICLGLDPFNVLRRALCGQVGLSLEQAQQEMTRCGQSEIFVVPHTGQWMSAAGGLEGVAPQWKRIANRLRELRDRRDRRNRL